MFTLILTCENKHTMIKFHGHFQITSTIQKLNVYIGSLLLALLQIYSGVSIIREQSHTTFDRLGDLF